MKDSHKLGINCLIAFLIPVIVVLIVCYICSVFPFSGKTLLYLDADTQHLNYLGYLKTILSGENDIFYSLSKNGGSGLFDFLAYYLLNPLNIVMMFFKDSYNDIAYHTIYVLTIGLAGSAFYYMLSKLYQNRPLNFIFSTTYSLCAYNFMYVINIWAVGLIMLPFQILAIEHLVKNKKILFYILVTLAGIFIQPFCAYMILMFTGLWFIYRLFLEVEKTDILKTITLYIVANLSAFALSAFWTLPVKNMLAGGKYTPTIGFDFSPAFHFSEIFRNIYTGSIIGLGTDNAPFIFIGTALLLLVFLYFACEAFSKKEKIASGVFFVFLLMSFYISAFLTVWNAFTQYPDANIFRSCNVLVFFALILAYQAFVNVDKINKKWVYIVFGLYLIISAWVLLSHNAINSVWFVVIDCLFALVTVLLILSAKDVKKIGVMVVAVACLQLVDVTINSSVALSKSNEYNLSEVDYYKAHNSKVNGLVNYIKKNDKTLFRTESNSTGYREYYAIKYNNMPLNYNYNGISHYSSLGKFYVVDFYRKLGFETGDNAHILMHYEPELPAFTDFFSGIKYIITHNELPNKEYEQIFDSAISETEPFRLYKNPYALPLMFVASKDFENKNLDNFKSFSYMNELAKAVSGQNFGDIFEIEEVNNYFIPENRFILKFNYDTHHDLPLYLSILQDNAPPRFDTITLNDYTISPAVADVNLNTVFLGRYPDREKISVGLEHRYNNDAVVFKETDFFFPHKLFLKKQQMKDYFANETKYLPLKLYLGYENQEIIRKYYDSILENPVYIHRISSSHFKARVYIPDDNRVLLTTIPYEDDWKITVDKKKVKAVKALGAMIAIPLSEGEHIIDMRYIPKGLFEGSIISILALIILIFCFRRNRDYI